MKALVLSGGTGTRMRPFSYAMPKQLIPVANRPVLFHVLDNVRRLGVTDVGLVSAGDATAIRDAVGDGTAHGLRITHIRQDRPLGLAHAVQVAGSYLGDDDFVLYLGDNVLTDGLADIAARFRAERPAAHLIVRKVPDPRAYGVVELAPDATVTRLVEKPDRPRSDLALVGVYFLTARIHRAIAAIGPSARGELELTDAVQRLIDDGVEVRATEYGGYWRDVGQVADLLECNRYLLADLRPQLAGQVDPASRVHGPVRVEPGARVVRSRIDGPVLIGADTVVEDSVIGPGTAVGAGCLIRRSGLTDSIVMAGARITDTPGLDQSIIGHGAVVDGGTRAAPRRLLVTDHSLVQVPR
ncbi:glucose-1-phosphate thymidylyltransferase [Solwaraspora sp. WMMA2056]|uniref:glucose-1-phosphate thymidylyltransferase n=1 Tax=Solwaraspora sp. WMMA2056 TaxID=3015161 RepID=UPI00259B9B93|nr:glucose-1-phosphate thymidylyltransferase [Solwaraspora sp. WMMA2056]WJK42582.1 glucose-1-phosphate thymidylyltransferase [Solwaraspora sp. WMMA2056]